MMFAGLQDHDPRRILTIGPLPTDDWGRIIDYGERVLQWMQLSNSGLKLGIPRKVFLYKNQDRRMKLNPKDPTLSRINAWHRWKRMHPIKATFIDRAWLSGKDV